MLWGGGEVRAEVDGEEREAEREKTAVGCTQDDDRAALGNYRLRELCVHRETLRAYDKARQRCTSWRKRDWE